MVRRSDNQPRHGYSISQRSWANREDTLVVCGKGMWVFNVCFLINPASGSCCWSIRTNTVSLWGRSVKCNWCPVTYGGNPWEKTTDTWYVDLNRGTRTVRAYDGIWEIRPERKTERVASIPHRSRAIIFMAPRIFCWGKGEPFEKNELF